MCRRNSLVTSSFLLLVVRPGATSSVLAPSSDAGFLGSSEAHPISHIKAVKLPRVKGQPQQMLPVDIHSPVQSALCPLVESPRLPLVLIPLCFVVFIVLLFYFMFASYF